MKGIYYTHFGFCCFVLFLQMGKLNWRELGILCRDMGLVNFGGETRTSGFITLKYLLFHYDTICPLRSTGKHTLCLSFKNV